MKNHISKNINIVILQLYVQCEIREIIMLMLLGTKIINLKEKKINLFFKLSKKIPEFLILNYYININS